MELDIENINMDKLQVAANMIKAGGLVAFPTETVYGLGASALDDDAVQSIFKAKGRPSDNPLIVHISDMGMLNDIAAEVPEIALRLAEKFWPGPLTLVFKKSAAIPAVITAGLDTVAVRMPSHPVALGLIMLCGVPVAAPSANISGKPSPTSAQHVISDLSGKIDAIINAGSSEVGVESTVLDITVSPPVILRPGGITHAQISGVMGQVEVDPALLNMPNVDIKPKSPGMKYTHYSPKGDVFVIEGELSRVVEKIRELSAYYKAQGMAVGILATDETSSFYVASTDDVISMGSRANPATIAANLFSALREFDAKNAQVILAEAVDSTGIGLAIMNRLNKAAGYNIINA